MSDYQSSMSDAEFEEFALTKPNAAIESGDPRVTSNEVAFRACALAAGRWALEAHPVQLVQLPDLAMAVVSNCPRFFINDDNQEEILEAQAREDEVTQDARALLSELDELNWAVDYDYGEKELAEWQASVSERLARFAATRQTKDPGAEARVRTWHVNRIAGEGRGIV